MFDKEQVINNVAKVFQNNLGNRITVELANGMIQEVIKQIPIIEEVKTDGNNTPAAGHDAPGDSKPESVNERK